MAYERKGGKKKKAVIFKGCIILLQQRLWVFFLFDAFSEWSPAVAAGLAAVAFGLQRWGLGASFSQLERNQDRGCLLATTYAVSYSSHERSHEPSPVCVCINLEDYTRSPIISSCPQTIPDKYFQRPCSWAELRPALVYWPCCLGRGCAPAACWPAFQPCRPSPPRRSAHAGASCTWTGCSWPAPPADTTGCLMNWRFALFIAHVLLISSTADEWTYRFLSLSFETLHLHLELINEILQSDQILLVFLSLQERKII